MKLKNIAIAFLGALLFATCSKKDDEKEYTAEESKAVVRNTMNNFYDCLKKLNDGGFANFFHDLLFKETVRDHRGETQSWGNFLGEKFEAQDYWDPQKNTEGKFAYQALKGTYTWNKNRELWDKEANGSNITFIFPATKEAATNNGKLVIDQYEDFEATYGNDKVYLPTAAHLYATIDNIKVFEVTVKNVTFEKKTNFTMPLSAHISIYTNPFTTTIQWNRQNPENFIFDFAFSSPQGCTTGLHADIKLTTSDYGNITNLNEAIDKIAITATQGEFQIRGNIDVKSLNEKTERGKELSVEQINTYARAELFKGNSKIADVKYEKENDKGVIYFIFSDGSREKAESYVSDFQDRVTEIFKRFERENN